MYSIHVSPWLKSIKQAPTTTNTYSLTEASQNIKHYETQILQY